MNQENATQSASGRPTALRRKYLINPKIQYKLVIFSFAISVIQGLILYFIYRTLLFKFVEGLPLSGEQIRQTVLGLLSQYNWIFAGVSLVLTIFMAFYLGLGWVLFSHSMVGPIFAMRRFLQAVAKDETPRPLKLRKSDFFSDLCGDINEIVKKYRPDIYTSETSRTDGTAK